MITSYKCLLAIAIMLSLSFPTQSTSAADQFWVYVGTYTRGSDSQGIYQLLMDAKTGKLTHVKTTKNVDNPSFLAIHPNQKTLFAVNEIGDFQGQKAGAVSSFAINAKTGELTFLNQQSSKGAAPCHLVVDATGKYVLVANYTGGNICSLPIRKNGKLKASAAFVQHTGSSVNSARQKAPHAHSINLDKQNQHAIVADLGIDQLLVYQFDSEDGSLKANTIPSIKMPPGAGPRHFAFHPTGKWGYVINELNRTITAMDYDAKNGSFQEIQTISTVPAGTAAKGNSTAEVQVHPSGKFLYGSNRGPNTLAMYRIDEQTGKLTSLGFQSTGGAIPRNFKIDPTGNFLLAANQETNNIVVFRINQQTGVLEETEHEIQVPKPVCIKFLPVPSTP
ncbi:lactonase family protein [uncultured Gimesia sp.]|uniref:lactonase family protein n=1 Tax=uncultured Gimesia sp. TaxID=1678688 RepID=UPI0030D931E2|tara:strand:- start:243171 stop:244343 length:1173 start_codon:yes stop_codon:yes gene_type:complete